MEPQSPQASLCPLVIWHENSGATYHIGELRQDKLDPPGSILALFPYSCLKRWGFRSAFLWDPHLQQLGGQIHPTQGFSVPKPICPEPLVATCNLAFLSRKYVSWPPHLLGLLFLSSLKVVINRAPQRHTSDGVL